MSRRPKPHIDCCLVAPHRSLRRGAAFPRMLFALRAGSSSAFEGPLALVDRFFGIAIFRAAYPSNDFH